MTKDFMEYEDEVGEVVDSFAMNLVDLIGRNGRVEWSIVSSEDPSRSSERDKFDVKVKGDSPEEVVDEMEELIYGVAKRLMPKARRVNKVGYCEECGSKLVTFKFSSEDVTVCPECDNPEEEIERGDVDE